MNKAHTTYKEKPKLHRRRRKWTDEIPNRSKKTINFEQRGKIPRLILMTMTVPSRLWCRVGFATGGNSVRAGLIAILSKGSVDGKAWIIDSRR